MTCSSVSVFRGCHASSLSRSDCFPSLFFFFNGYPLQLAVLWSPVCCQTPAEMNVNRSYCWLLRVFRKMCSASARKTGHIFPNCIYFTNVSVLIGSLSYKGFRCFGLSIKKSDNCCCFRTLKYIHLSEKQTNE